jgi:hypothetical protein
VEERAAAVTGAPVVARGAMAALHPEETVADEVAAAMAAAEVKAAAGEAAAG